MEHHELEAGIIKYEEHLNEIAKVFNDSAERNNLPVRMNPSHAIEAVKNGINLAQIATFWTRLDDTGIVHATQIKTAIDCIPKLLNESKRCGHIVGAMQSGKTTTSLALQWAGPIMYLLTGERAYPFYIIGNQTGHEDQTRTELDRFLAYYGNIEFHLESKIAHEKVDPMFIKSPSLITYRRVLLGALDDIYEVPKIEELHRRVGGNQSLQKIVDISRRAAEQGCRSLMIIDEPQFGASDRLIAGENGLVQRKCVLAQIFDRIEQELGSTRGDHWFIGLSATPFELNDLERVWEVRQYLTKSYSGFNYFNSSPISEDVEIVPPKTMSLSQFSSSINVPFLAKVVMSAYDDSKPETFARHARRLDFSGDHSSYRRKVEAALREAIYALLEQYKTETDEPVGLCIRAFNDNAKTQALLKGLNLDPDRIEVIEYYGTDVSNMSVKRAVARRARQDLPYIIFVTNRARMADAFPAQVRFFMDFAQKASDLNALLQGLLGRACGYNKKSTVVLSDANNNIVDAYIITKGAYVHRTSRHSIPVGGYRRGAPTGMLKLRDDMDDEKIATFFKRVNNEVVDPNIESGAPRLSAKRKKGDAKFRTGPILSIEEELELFDHLESFDVKAKIFPSIPTAFRIARRNDAIRHSHKVGAYLKYSFDENGNCRFTFRWSDRQSAAQGGAAGRAKGKKDVGQHMEPTIYVEKYDPESGEIIDDRKEAVQRPGKWRAFMITFPLVEPVREVKAATVAYPTRTAVYNDWMTEAEKQARNLASEK